MLLDIVLGIVGAFVGGWLFNQFGNAGVSGFNLYSLLVATVGASWVSVSTEFGCRPVVCLDLDRNTTFDQADALQLADGIRKAADIVALITSTTRTFTS